MFVSSCARAITCAIWNYMATKLLLALLLGHALIFSVMISHAKGGEPIQGIVAGEPDPNGKNKLPGDVGTPEAKAKECPKGERRYAVMECVDPSMKDKRALSEDCETYVPLLHCHKRPYKIHCKSGNVPRQRIECVKLKR